MFNFLIWEVEAVTHRNQKRTETGKGGARAHMKIRSIIVGNLGHVDQYLPESMKCLFVLLDSWTFENKKRRNEEIVDFWIIAKTYNI